MRSGAVKTGQNQGRAAARQVSATAEVGPRVTAHRGDLDPVGRVQGDVAHDEAASAGFLGVVVGPPLGAVRVDTNERLIDAGEGGVRKVGR